MNATGPEDLIGERVAAAARNEEYAEPLDLGFVWDSAAPLPHLVCNEDRALVLFYLRRRITGPSMSPVSISAVNSGQARLGIINFTGVSSIRFGGPNDEGLDSHRLFGKGLDFYAAHEVVGSRWLRDEGIDQESCRHFILTFQDSVFECLAKGFQAEQVEGEFASTLKLLVSRLAESSR